MRKHHELKVWQEALDLAQQVYAWTDTFPTEERYGLISQMRRASVSIPSNIAEGAARTTRREFLHFLSVARGSLAELETQLVIAGRLGYLSSETNWQSSVDNLFGKLGSLIKSLQAKKDA